MLGLPQGNVYQRFVVQSLIANHTWSSRVDQGAALYHVGTMPDKRGDIFVSDLRLMVGKAMMCRCCYLPPPPTA